jgi:hypothetical protein
VQTNTVPHYTLNKFGLNRRRAARLQQYHLYLRLPHNVKSTCNNLFKYQRPELCSCCSRMNHKEGSWCCDKQTLTLYSSSCFTLYYDVRSLLGPCSPKLDTTFLLEAIKSSLIATRQSFALQSSAIPCHSKHYNLLRFRFPQALTFEHNANRCNDSSPF